MIATLKNLVGRLPGPSSAQWPEGEPFTEVMRHGTMSVEIFAPRGADRQTPHEQDELYFIASGTARFLRGERDDEVAAGDAVFVRAREVHRFERMSVDFLAWVVFWGPAGGEGDR
jgi:mannose-6-phosphate isomerase-like protein (cupin superfamily)